MDVLYTVLLLFQPALVPHHPPGFLAFTLPSAFGLRKFIQLLITHTQSVLWIEKVPPILLIDQTKL